MELARLKPKIAGPFLFDKPFLYSIGSDTFSRSTIPFAAMAQLGTSSSQRSTTSSSSTDPEILSARFSSSPVREIISFSASQAIDLSILSSKPSLGMVLARKVFDKNLLNEYLLSIPPVAIKANICVNNAGSSLAPAD